MITVKIQNRLCLYFCWAIIFFLVILTRHNSFFWDTVQLASKHANYYYSTHFSSLLLPTAMDSGHIPAFGIYIALLWQLLERSLEVSHLGMLPFALGIVWQAFKLCSKFIPEQYIGLALILLVADPSLLSQMTLVSPDVCLVFFFLWGMNAVLENNKLSLAFAVFLLFLTSMRGMMVSVCLLGLDLYLNVEWKKTFRQTLNCLFNRSLIYLPAFMLFAAFSSFHYYATGWIGFHKDSPWAESFERIDNFNSLLFNLGLYGWRLLDFGRFGGWIICLILFANYGKQLAKSKKIVLLLFFSLGMMMLLPMNMIWAKNLMGHRYLIPIYLTFSLLVATTLFSSFVKNKFRFIVFLFWACCLIGGNFIVYPEKIAKGWDSTLAHLPYYNLRHQAIAFLDNENIESQEVQSFFPNLASMNLIDLNGDERRFTFYNGKGKYVFYSNVFNVTDLEYDEIHDRRNYECIKKFESDQVFVHIFKKVTP